MRIPSHCPACGAPLGSIAAPALGERLRCPYCNVGIGDGPSPIITPPAGDVRVKLVAPKTDSNGCFAVLGKVVFFGVLILFFIGWFIGKSSSNKLSIMPTYAESPMGGTDSITIKKVEIKKEKDKDGEDWYVNAIVENWGNRNIHSIQVQAILMNADNTEIDRVKIFENDIFGGTQRLFKMKILLPSTVRSYTVQASDVIYEHTSSYSNTTDEAPKPKRK